MQHIVQFVGIAHVGPSLLLHLRDRRGIERPDFFEHRRRQHAPHLDRPRPALFERRIIQVRIGIRIKNFVRELRRHRSVHGEATNPPLLDAAQHFAEAFDIQRFGEHVFHDLAHQRMVGNLDVPFDIFLARRHIGKNRGQQIVRAHALNLRRNFLAALKTQQSQRARCIPAPARPKDRRSQRRLLQNWRHGLGMQKLKNIGQRETVLLGERDVQAIVGGGGLQFEIEAAAEALAQRQSPSLVDPSAKGRVDDQLHPAAFIKKTFGNDRRLRGHVAQHGASFERCTGSIARRPADRGRILRAASSRPQRPPANCAILRLERRPATGR